MRATGKPDARSTQKSVGIRGVNPSNLHDCHPISGRQQENAVGGGDGTVPGVSRWETVKFRAFSVREAKSCDGRVQSCAPRVVLRFEGLENGFRTYFLKLDSLL